MEALLRFDNVSKQYPNGVHALNGVSFTKVHPAAGY